MVNDTELIRRIIALFPIVSKDETRYHLNGLVIESDTERRQLFLIVTDGHRMIKETVQHDSLPELMMGQRWQVFKEQVDMFKLVLKEFGKLEMVIVSNFDNHTGLITFNDKFSIKLSECKNYPDVDRLVPKEKATIKLGLNAKYLLDISKALRESSRQEAVCIEFTPDKDGKVLGPFLVSCTGNKTKAVLMPVKV